MRWLVFLLFSGLVATCGQKGPLSLPEEESRGGSSMLSQPSGFGVPALLGWNPAPWEDRSDSWYSLSRYMVLLGWNPPPWEQRGVANTKALAEWAAGGKTPSERRGVANTKGGNAGTPGTARHGSSGGVPVVFWRPTMGQMGR